MAAVTRQLLSPCSAASSASNSGGRGGRARRCPQCPQWKGPGAGAAPEQALPAGVELGMLQNTHRGWKPSHAFHWRV